MNFTDDRFPFKLKEKNAKKIIDIACNDWTEKLAKIWGADLLVDSYVMISEEFYREMRLACTEPQNKLFDKIFGEDVVIEYKVGDFVVWSDPDKETEEVIEIHSVRKKSGWIGSRDFADAYIDTDEEELNHHTPRLITREATEEEVKELLRTRPNFVLTTVDGVDIFAGDPYSFFWSGKKAARGRSVLKVYDVKKATKWASDECPDPEVLVFSTHELAEEHLNKFYKKHYTYQDMKDATEMDRKAGSFGNIQLGSKVKIIDGSYMIFSETGKDKSPHIPIIGWNKDVWKIIEVNTAFPTDKRHMPKVLGYQNNCKIKNTVNGEVWYCSKINIELV